MRAPRNLPGRCAAVDVALGAALGLSGVPGYLDRPWIAAGQALMGTGVTLRRVAPLTGALVVAGAFALQCVLAFPPDDQVALIAVPLAAYSVAAYAARPRAVAGLLALGTAVCLEIPLNHNGQYWYSLGIVLVGWLPGFFMYGRRVEVHRLEDAAERAVREERAGLARELHDVVSHSVGAMMIQAAAAEQTLDAAPETARAALQQVQRTGAEAVTELHRLLALLRDDRSAAATAPPPGLARIGELVEQAPGEVAYEVRGNPHPVGPALELSLYRIVQEALTNARRHAPGSAVSVRISWPPAVAAGTVEIDVRDSGATAAGHPGEPRPRRAGHGLLGMRERAALFDGRVRAGREGAGYRVHAVLGTDA